MGESSDMKVAYLLMVLAFQLAVFGVAGGKLWESTGGSFRRGFIFGAVLGPGWLLLAWAIKARRADTQNQAPRTGSDRLGV